MVVFDWLRKLWRKEEVEQPEEEVPSPAVPEMPDLAPADVADIDLPDLPVEEVAGADLPEAEELDIPDPEVEESIELPEDRPIEDFDLTLDDLPPLELPEPEESPPPGNEQDPDATDGLRESQNTWPAPLLLPGGGSSDPDPDADRTTLAQTQGTQDTDTWAFDATNGVNLQVVTDIKYDVTTHAITYRTRTMSFDHYGRLVAIAAEGNLVTVATAAACPA